MNGYFGCGIDIKLARKCELVHIKLGGLLMKSTLYVLFASLLVSATTAMAGEDYVCDYDGEKRIISIAYSSDQQAVPCEVRYDKGQGVETLWTAQTEVGYCEKKASEFIEKQESWGWTCDKFEQPMSEVPLEELQTSVF